MITFKQYLTEDELIMVTPSQAAKFIAENCQQFLRDTEFRINHGFTHAIIESPVLYRGLGNFSRSNGYILSGQRNRTPVDSSRELTETLDTYFKQHFRYPYRQQGVFCSGRPASAASYGNTFIIFPTDGYDSVWSNEIADAYTAFDWRKDGEFPSFARRVCLNMEEINPFTEDIPIDEAWEKWYVILYAWLQEFHPYNSGDIVSAMEHGLNPEIMLRCKSYVAVPIENAYHSEFVEEMLEITKNA